MLVRSIYCGWCLPWICCHYLRAGTDFYPICARTSIDGVRLFSISYSSSFFLSSLSSTIIPIDLEEPCPINKQNTDVIVLDRRTSMGQFLDSAALTAGTSGSSPTGSNDGKKSSSTAPMPAMIAALATGGTQHDWEKWKFAVHEWSDVSRFVSTMFVPHRITIENVIFLFF